MMIEEEEDGLDELEDESDESAEEEETDGETEVKLPFGPKTPLVIAGQSGIRPASALKAHDRWVKNKIKEIDKLRLRAIDYLKEHGRDNEANEVLMVHRQQQELRKEYYDRRLATS